MTTSGAFVNRSNNTSRPERAPKARSAEAACTSAEAVLDALKPFFEESATTVALESLRLTRVGSSDAVLVKLLYTSGEDADPLLGSALVGKDIGTAAARAVVDALDRKLSLSGSGLVLGSGEV